MTSKETDSTRTEAERLGGSHDPFGHPYSQKNRISDIKAALEKREGEIERLRELLAENLHVYEVSVEARVANLNRAEAAEKALLKEKEKVIELEKRIRNS